MMSQFCTVCGGVGEAFTPEGYIPCPSCHGTGRPQLQHIEPTYATVAAARVPCKYLIGKAPRVEKKLAAHTAEVEAFKQVLIEKFRKMVIAYLVDLSELADYAEDNAHDPELMCDYINSLYEGAAKMAMEKYGVDMSKAKKLKDKGKVKDLQEGIEKVASGEADKLLKEKKEKP